MSIKQNGNQPFLLKNNSKIALITGITGQDGSYLSEFLLKKGYEVHGLTRRDSRSCFSRIDHLINDSSIFGKKFFMHRGDITDSANLVRLLKNIGPDEIYNLAAQSHVQVSFETPENTSQINAIGVLKF
ncbi:hypothetical protein MHBO_000252 [Bonamia ostreae]|uniref:GDP-mannose 4,6-dehydratase n=1 Tax=Bonamia ostreae TaxID=126728 RepID=A0ABV2AEZ9_9EUKA